MSRAVGIGGGRRPDCERGSVSVLFVFIVLTAVTLATFLVDAGTQLQVATRADTYAAEAARAAANALGPVPNQNPQSTAAAVRAAQAYLTAAGVSGRVTVLGPATVQVSVTATATTPVLGLTVSQTRMHTATLLLGVTTGEPVR